MNDLTLFVHSIGITCYTCQPLITNDQLLGTFSFGTRSRLEYTAEELQLIQLVCDQVAIAAARDLSREQQVTLERIAVAGQMAAKIAHEINNPLEAVTNLLFLLDSEEMRDEAKRYLTMAQEQVDRVAEISKQVLGYYRQTREPAPVNLRHTTDNVVAAAKFTAAKKRLSFDIDVPRELRVYAIDAELVQILTNLVANAIHYSPEGEHVHIAALRKRSEVEVFVSDRGRASFMQEGVLETTNDSIARSKAQAVANNHPQQRDDCHCKRRSKNRSQYAAGAAFCGGVKVVRRNLVS